MSNLKFKNLSNIKPIENSTVSYQKDASDSDISSKIAYSCLGAGLIVTGCYHFAPTLLYNFGFPIGAIIIASCVYTILK